MKYRQIFASGLAAAVLVAAPLWGPVPIARSLRKQRRAAGRRCRWPSLHKAKASNQAVKDLANKLVADHTKANDNLKPIATKDNITWPTAMDAKAQSEYNKLQALSGADFDREYVNFEVKDHKEDIKLFQHEVVMVWTRM